MGTLLQCSNCGWTGEKKECSKGIEEIRGTVQDILICPKCGSEGLSELAGKPSNLTPALAQ